ncbi:MAG: enoyl-CoA hydratase [Mycobacterium sp.]|nr:enoyl-CoA hydratase [Mycobacterium sp.]
MYDMPTEIDVQADGSLRIITLNRPDSLNSVNDDLHHGLAKLWQRLSDDRSARAAVITGAGRAFSAGGDFAYLAELAGDADLRAKTIADGARSCWAWLAAVFRWWPPSTGRRSDWAAAWSR